MLKQSRDQDVCRYLLSVRPLKVEITGKNKILSAGKKYETRCQSTGSIEAASGFNMVESFEAAQEDH